MHLLLYVCFFLVLLQQSHAAKRKFKECETEYLCYVRAKAFDGSFEVQKVRFNKEVDFFENTEIVMIHAYNEKHFRILFEAFNNAIETIELVKDSKHVFSCVKKNDMVTFYSGEEKTVADEKSTVASKPLKCEVEFKSLRMLILTKNDKFELKTVVGNKPETTTKQFTIDDDFLFCDPFKLKKKFDKLNKTKAYGQVKMHLTEAFCNDKHGEEGRYNAIEIRKDKTSEYVTIEPSKLQCDKREGKFVFVVKDQQGNNIMEFLDKSANIDARCVGESKFFCDYDPKVTPNKQRMNRTKGKGIESKLECLEPFPYSVIRGGTYKNPKLECLAYTGGVLYWTFDGGIIGKDGPPIHCVDEMPCEIIPQKYLKGAFINSQRLPTCNYQGQLQIEEINKDGTKERKDVKFHCTKEGELRYELLPSLDIVLWKLDKPHLYCLYDDEKEDENARIQRENMMLIFTFAGSSGLLCFVLSAGIMWWVIRRLSARQKEMIRRANEADALASRRFKMRKHEENKSAEDELNTNRTGTTTKSTAQNGDSSNRKVVNMDELFDLKNGEIIVIPPTKGQNEKNADAIKRNDKDRYRINDFPDGYKMVEPGEESKATLMKGQNDLAKRLQRRRNTRNKKKDKMEDQARKEAKEKMAEDKKKK